MVAARAFYLQGLNTDYLQGKAYVLYNEPSNSNAKLRQKAKNLRTDTHNNINNKYGAKYRIPNIITFGFTTNEDYPFGISEQARRDWFEFIMDLERDYTQGLRRYLKEDLGLHALVRRRALLRRG